MVFQRKYLLAFLVIGLLIFLVSYILLNNNLDSMTNDKSDLNQIIKLPETQKEGQMSIEEAIESRRSIRNYLDKPVDLDKLGQVLWSAQGITDDGGYRSAPSAGATYPLTVYITVREETDDLLSGVYKYKPDSHSIKRISDEDISEKLSQVALNQTFIAEAPINLILTAVYERTTERYGKRGERYVHIEVGHVAQNIYLQSESLGLGTVAVGAFDDDKVHDLLQLSQDEVPVYIMPVGHQK